MTLYKVEHVDGTKIEIIDTENPRKKKTFISRIKDFYREGDVVAYDSEIDRYVFLDTSASLMGNKAIMNLTDGGRLTYDELTTAQQELYDEAMACVKECFDNPELMTYQESAKFAAKRLAVERVLRGE